MVSGSCPPPVLRSEARMEFDRMAGVPLPDRIEVFQYNGRQLIGDVRLKHVDIDGVCIESPDNYFTLNSDGTRPYDVLFGYTPGEHLPDWDYTREALLGAAALNPGRLIIDGGCGTGIKSVLMGKYLAERGLDNQILLVDPNARAIETSFGNIRLNNLNESRYLSHLGTLRSAVSRYRNQEIAAAYINPPYQAHPPHRPIVLHCDGGSDGLRITRELLEDLMPYMADRGVIAVHTKSPAFEQRRGFSVWPLILDNICEGKIVPNELLNEYEIRFSRSCPPMDLYEFYRLVYRNQENEFARNLADAYPLIDMTLMLLERRNGNTKVTVREDPAPANPEMVDWGYSNGRVVRPGHILWHRLFVPETQATSR